MVRHLNECGINVYSGDGLGSVQKHRKIGSLQHHLVIPHGDQL